MCIAGERRAMEKEMEKEQRRRKIIARGTDRMALITGRINTLDPDPIAKCSSFSVNRPDLPTPQHARSSSEPLSANEQPLFQYGAYESPNEILKHVEEASKGNDSRNRVSEAHRHNQKELAAALAPNNAHSSHKNALNLLGPFTSQAINSCIVSSEDIRAISSAALGVFVVLTQIVFHYWKPECLVAFRPLFVVVFTDLVIVGVKLLPHARTRKEESKDEEEEEEEDNGLDGAVKLFEMGLVLHRLIGAIFIDCSFYLAVVVLGLSLV